MKKFSSFFSFSLASLSLFSFLMINHVQSAEVVNVPANTSVNVVNPPVEAVNIVPGTTVVPPTTNYVQEVVPTPYYNNVSGPTSTYYYDHPGTARHYDNNYYNNYQNNWNNQRHHEHYNNFHHDGERHHGEHHHNGHHHQGNHQSHHSEHHHSGHHGEHHK